MMMYFCDMKPSNRHIVRLVPQIVYGGVDKTKEKAKVIFRCKYTVITLRGSLNRMIT